MSARLSSLLPSLPPSLLPSRLTYKQVLQLVGGEDAGAALEEAANKAGKDSAADLVRPRRDGGT